MPAWGFDLRCTGAAGAAPADRPGQMGGGPRAEVEGAIEAGAAPAPLPTDGHCWLAVPLTRGKLALYDLGRAPWPDDPAP